MASPSDKNKKKNSQLSNGRPVNTPVSTPVFTIDTDPDFSGVQEVPGITKLLNRKRLNTTSKPVQTLDSPAAGTQIQRVTRRRTASQNIKLKLWTELELQAESDSIRSGLFALLRKTSFHALILLPKKTNELTQETSLKNKNLDDHSILYIAVSAFNPGHFLKLWSGIRVTPQVFPEIWPELLTQGFLEFPPLSEKTSASKRELRNFLGVGSEDWLTLICHGAPSLCSGLIVIVSTVGVSEELPKAFEFLIPFFSSHPWLKKPKAA